MIRKLAAVALLALATATRAQDATLELGDSFTGAIDSAFDSDAVAFSGVAGTLITATVTGQQGFLPTLMLVDQGTAQAIDVGDALKGTGTKKVSIKKFPLPSTGDYSLVLGPAAAQTGAYKLTTKGKPGKAQKSFKVDGAVAPGGAAISFGALPGTTLTATVKPDKGAAVTPGVPLLDTPSGPQDISAHVTLNDGKVPTATIDDLPLDDLGDYVFTPVASSDGEALPVTTKLKLKFPKVIKTIFVEQPVFGNTDSELVSQSSAGEQAAANSLEAAASFNGHRIAFLSHAINLVAGCGGASVSVNQDVFVRDLDLHTTDACSAPSGSSDGQGGCNGVAIDSDGINVAFGSAASGLVADDTNGAFDIFVRNTSSGVTTRVSVQSDGDEAHGASTPQLQPGLGLSGDGNLVVFESDAADLVEGDDNGVADIFLHELGTGATTRVSTSAAGAQADGASSEADISVDGLRVAFTSAAANLLGGDGNGKTDVYVKLLATGEVLRASLRADDAELASDSTAPSLSGDGRFVAFVSQGAFVTGDSNGKLDVFVKDLQTGAVDIASISSGGTVGNNHSTQPKLSASGQLVIFRSLATQLVSGSDANGAINGDIFLRDRPALNTTRIDLSSFGDQADGDCYVGDFSADASHAVFFGLATNITPGLDANNAFDVWVRF